MRNFQEFKRKFISWKNKSNG